MSNRLINFSVVVCLLLLQPSCGWLSKKPLAINSQLEEALQSTNDTPVSQRETTLPYRLHYELKHKAMPGREFAIELEIIASQDIPVFAYAVKSPEVLRLMEPKKIIHIEDLKAGQRYRERVVLKPDDEGLYVVKVFSTTSMSTGLSAVSEVQIPVAIGAFQAKP